MVPDRADTWTRMVYAGPNKPIAPIDDPYQMFAKLYGRREGSGKPQERARRPCRTTSRKSRAAVSAPRTARLLDEHATFVREMEQELAQQTAETSATRVPELGAGRAGATTTTCRSSARCRST